MRAPLILLLADSTTTRSVEGFLSGSRAGPFNIESTESCRDGIDRLLRPRAEPIAAVVLDMFLEDSQGLDTFEAIFRAAPHLPIVIICREQDQHLASLAVRHGAQDYLLDTQLNSWSLPRLLDSMLARQAFTATALVASEQTRVTLDSIGDAVISADIAGKVTYMNSVAEQLTGWSWTEASDRPIPEILHIVDASTREPIPNPLAAAAQIGKAVNIGNNCLLIRRDGQECAIEDTATPIRDRNGHITGAVIVFHDVSAARSISLRNSHLAQHDFLTNLPNRMLLRDRLTQAITTAHRHQTLLALLYLDVDQFKRVNDTLGHGIGDQLLQSIATRLLACVRGSDTVSRPGGDEFVIVLGEVAYAADVAATTRKIRTALRAPHLVANHYLTIGVSLGVSMYPDDGTTADTLLSKADANLIYAKLRGHRPTAATHSYAPPESSAPAGLSVCAGVQNHRPRPTYHPTQHSQEQDT